MDSKRQITHLLRHHWDMKKMAQIFKPYGGDSNKYIQTLYYFTKIKCWLTTNHKSLEEKKMQEINSAQFHNLTESLLLQYFVLLSINWCNRIQFGLWPHVCQYYTYYYTEFLECQAEFENSNARLPIERQSMHKRFDLTIQRTVERVYTQDSHSK